MFLVSKYIKGREEAIPGSVFLVSKYIKGREEGSTYIREGEGGRE